MKICFFDFITLVGGATKGTVYLLERLKAKGINVHAINVYGDCEEYLDDLISSNIDYDILLKKNIKNTTIGFNDNYFRRLFEILKQLPHVLLILIKLLAVIIKVKPTHLMVNNRKSLFFVFLFKYFFRFKIVYYNRIEATSCKFPKYLIFLLNFSVDFLLSHSKNSIFQMKNLGVNKNIIYLPNCVKINKNLFKIDKNNNMPFTIFLNAGRIVKEKGYHTALYALNELVKAKYNVVLKLPGFPTDNSYLNELKVYIQKNNLEDRVIFCNWIENIQQEIVNSQCMILPSYSEGFPRSIIEAMLLGVPVCATPVGGIPEAIIDNETGFLFDVEDHLTLSNKIESLINDIDLYNKISENAYDYALQNFSESINTQIFIKTVKSYD